MDSSQDGEEIVNDVMSHERQDASPFTKKIQWDPETKKVDYFGIFFRSLLSISCRESGNTGQVLV